MIRSPFYGKIPLAPPDTPVSEEVMAWAEGIVREGIARLNWKNLPIVHIHFCEQNTLNMYGPPRVVGGMLEGPRGIICEELPDSIFITTAFLHDRFLTGAFLLHELFHLYQMNTTGVSTDGDFQAYQWSRQVAQELLTHPNNPAREPLRNVESQPFRPNMCS